MDFANERYVRLYTRDTTSWMFLGWEGQAVFSLLLRKVDRAGVFDLCGVEPVRAVAAMLNMPQEIVKVGLARLLDGQNPTIEHCDDSLIVVKFIEAQEASMSGPMRQQESRLRRRDRLRQGIVRELRECVIYFVQPENGGNIKIGQAGDLAKRLVQLNCDSPERLVLLAAATGKEDIEKALHARFAHLRVKGEWFKADVEILSYVKLVKELGSAAFRDMDRNVTGDETPVVTPSVPCLTSLEDPPIAPQGAVVGGTESPEAPHQAPRAVQAPCAVAEPGPDGGAVEPRVPKHLRVEKNPEYHPAFREFWRNYPKRQHPDAAYRAWKKAAKAAGGHEALLAACREVLPAWKEHRSWLREDGQFIPNPERWLNAGSWREAPEV